jgi:SAM-dependent methyltransferase
VDVDKYRLSCIVRQSRGACVGGKAAEMRCILKLFNSDCSSVTVSRNDVIEAYNIILGRQPESEEVINSHLQARDRIQLWKTFLSSDEFVAHVARFDQKRVIHGVAVPMPLTIPPNIIETDVDDAILEQLVAKTEVIWDMLGTTDPYWSVLSDQRYSNSAFEANSQAFYESGREDVEIIQALIRRCAPDFDLRRAVVAEYGCGVGRVTSFLARHVSEIIACDISSVYLELGKKYVERVGGENVSWRKVTQLNLMPFETCDLWYSRIVLQHNPPPMIARLLSLAFERIRPGGVAIFQLPTFCINYSFNATQYLNDDKPASIEMHVLRQSTVFELMERAGLKCVDVREDNSAGAPGIFISNMFVARRPP